MFRLKTSQQIQFEGLHFTLKRIAFKKGISIILRPQNKYTITASVMLPEKYIWSFLEEKREWIFEQHQNLLQIQEQKLADLQAGQMVPFLGEKLTLVFEYQKLNNIRVKREDSKLIMRFDTQRLALEPELTQTHLRRALRQFYQACAQQILPERVNKYAKTMGLKPRKLTFRDQKTRWGSCSSNGSISLNWKLVAAPLEIVDYVVVHELCHMKHPDHSSRFWALVETQVGQLKTRKKWLREHHRAFDFLSKTVLMSPL